jgi:hypothetical protein
MCLNVVGEEERLTEGTAFLGVIEVGYVMGTQINRWREAAKAIRDEAELVERLLTNPPQGMTTTQLANEMRISGGLIRNLAVDLTLSVTDER